MKSKTTVTSKSATPILHANHCSSYPFKRICWSAIFVGALVGLGLSFLLNLFGIAVGLSAISIGPNGSATLAVGGFLGFIIAMIAAMAAAGYTAGYLGRLYCPERNLGIIYGFTTWTVALVLSAALMGSVSKYSHHIDDATFVAGQASTSHYVKHHNGEAVAQVTSDEDKVVATTPTHLAQGAFLLFALFFIGAISTCIGACCGMSCRRED